MMPRLRLSPIFLLVASCGGGYPKPAQSPGPARSAPSSVDADDAAGESRSYSAEAEGPLSPQEEISMLFGDIGRMRESRGLTREPNSEAVQLAGGEPAPVAPAPREGTTPRLTDRCQDTCTIKDNICRNSARICELASELDDAWADEKCDSSKVSCKEAKASCDGCD